MYIYFACPLFDVFVLYGVLYNNNNIHNRICNNNLLCLVYPGM